MKKLFLFAALTVLMLTLPSEAKGQSMEDADWWLPRKEIGMRHGFGNAGYSREFTLGYRLDDWWTVGAAYSMEKTASLYARRYFYFGNKFKYAVFVDGMAGVNFADDTPCFAAKLEPGVMVRFFNNHQLFVGPSISNLGGGSFGFFVGFAI